jgi:hypothetical protein
LTHLFFIHIFEPKYFNHFLMKKILFFSMALIMGLVMSGGSCTPDATLVYAISVTPATLSFGSLVTGYATPATQTVTVTNTGTGPVKLSSLPSVPGWTLTPTTPPYFTGTALASGAKATFTIRPNTGLTVGTHTPTITITGSNSTSGTVKPTFTVTAAPVKTASVGTQIGVMTEGESDVVTFTVTTTNITNASYPVTVNNRPTGVTASSNITITGGTGTLTLTGSATTAANTYATLTLTIDGVTTEPFTLSILAAGVPTYTISASSLTSFGSLTTPYTQPAAQTVTITNTGTGSVTLTQPTSTDYLIGTLSTTTLATNGDTATFTVQPKAGLAVGNYDETITITGTGGATATATVNVSFTVTAALTYTISATPNNPSFGSLAEGYTSPSAQTITITNTGTGSVTLNTLPSVSNYTLVAGASYTTPLTPGATTDFTVQPNAGLTTGSYNPTFNVTGSGSASVTISPTFTVTPISKTVTVGTQSDPLIAVKGGTVTFQVTVTNIANGSTGSIEWFTDATGSTPRATPSGITQSVSNVALGEAVVTLIAAANFVTPNSYYFKVTIDGATSAVTTFTASPAFAGGVGTIADPYQIATAAQLALFAELVNGNVSPYRNANYILTADIDLGDYSTGTGWTPIGNSDYSFYSVFDGNHKTISGLYINDGTLENAGLFFRIEGATCVVKNLHLVGVDITADRLIGGLAGCIQSNARIINCSVSGAVRSLSGEPDQRVGGLVGFLSNSSITNCYSNATVSGKNYIGGIVGYFFSGSSVINCYSSATVSGITGIGGIAGMSGGSISNCYATGAVISSGNQAGGIVGAVATGCKIENCAALNPSVKATGSPGRIASYDNGDTFSGNLAWDDMGTDGGIAFPSVSGDTSVNGEDLTAANAKLQTTTWDGASSKLKWPFGSTDASPWKWGGGSYPLPILWWQTAAPVALPTHLQ